PAGRPASYMTGWYQLIGLSFRFAQGRGQRENTVPAVCRNGVYRLSFTKTESVAVTLPGAPNSRPARSGALPCVRGSASAFPGARGAWLPTHADAARA